MCCFFIYCTSLLFLPTSVLQSDMYLHLVLIMPHIAHIHAEQCLCFHPHNCGHFCVSVAALKQSVSGLTCKNSRDMTIVQPIKCVRKCIIQSRITLSCSITFSLRASLKTGSDFLEIRFSHGNLV